MARVLMLRMRRQSLLHTYFSLSRASWIPCATAWDRETGEFRRVEGQEGFRTCSTARTARTCAPSRGVQVRGRRPEQLYSQAGTPKKITKMACHHVDFHDV